LFILNEEGKRDKCGELVIISKHIDDVESHKRKKDRIIKFNYIENVVCSLMETITKGEIYFEHLCNSISETASYNISRYILIFAAFEREFRNIYGFDYGRSDKYLKTKEEAVRMFDIKIEESSGKVKGYYKEIQRFVSKLDIMLMQKIQVALNDCKDIMEPFIKYNYSDDFDETVDRIGERMNDLRNNVAHANLDLSIDTVHLTDLGIIQILLYAMRLKKLSVDQVSAKKALKDLFGIPIVIKDI
jgi:hypothetical protein